MYNELMNMFNDLTTMFDNGGLAADVCKDEAGYTVTIDIPGVKKENVTIDFSDSELTVTIKENEVTKKEYLTKERFQVKGSRTFYLKDANPNDIKAKISDGVLEIFVGISKSQSKEIVID